MDIVPIQVGGGGLQEPPVAAFVVGDVRLYLVVLPLVSDQHAFDSGHLRDAEEEFLPKHCQSAERTISVLRPSALLLLLPNDV